MLQPRVVEPVMSSPSLTHSCFLPLLPTC